METQRKAEKGTNIVAVSWVVVSVDYFDLKRNVLARCHVICAGQLPDNASGQVRISGADEDVHRCQGMLSAILVSERHSQIILPGVRNLEMNV